MKLHRIGFVQSVHIEGKEVLTDKPDIQNVWHDHLHQLLGNGSTGVGGTGGIVVSGASARLGFVLFSAPAPA